MPEPGERQRARSRQAITQAFVALMQEQDYAAIQVSEIIARANVGRTTFYRHFASKADILIALHEGIFERWMADFDSQAVWLGDMPSPRLIGFLEMVQRQRKRSTFSLAYNLGADLDYLFQQLHSLLAQHLHRALEQHFGPVIHHLPLDFLAPTLAGVYTTHILRWCSSDLPETPHTFARYLQRTTAALITAACRATKGEADAILPY